MFGGKALALAVLLGVLADTYGKSVFRIPLTNPLPPDHGSVRRWGETALEIIANRVHHEPVYELAPNEQQPREEEEEEVAAAVPIPAAGATPCETVAQWEGRASEWDHIQGNNNRFNISFDGVNRRKRIMEDKHAQLPGKRIYEYIMLYDEGIQYVVNHNYNTCTIQHIGTWRNHTIPPNATLEDRYEIGPPGSGFLVQEWSDRIPGRQKESWIGTFTDQGCWPITEIFMDKDENNTMVQSVSTRFFDLSRGIKTMSVFTPPDYCPKPRRSTPNPATPLPRPRPKSRPIRPRLISKARVVKPSGLTHPNPIISGFLAHMSEMFPEMTRTQIEKSRSMFERLADLGRLPERLPERFPERFPDLQLRGR